MANSGTMDEKQAGKQPGPEPVAVDIRGAMKMLNLGRSSVLGLAASGELPPLRFGRSVRYSTDDISALVERRRAAAREAGIYRITPPGREQ